MNIQSVLAVKGTTVATVGSGAGVEEAVERMTVANVGALVVLDLDGRLEGIISERDVARSVTPGRAVHELRVSDLMETEVTCATPEDEVVAVMQRMTDGRFRHVPVLSGGELVGIVSIGDLVKAQLSEYQGVIVTLETIVMGAGR